LRRRMTLYAGIDIGTSGVKVVLADATDRIHAAMTEEIAVDRREWKKPGGHEFPTVLNLHDLEAEHGRSDYG